ncbi:MAG: CxxC-x17-CxxC domain-containing protein [Patescibacteria group bacterium]|mgnify:CR=1 FL=1
MAFFKKPGGFGGGRREDRGGDRGGSRFGDKPRFGGGKPSFGNKGGFRGSDDRGGFGGRPPVQLFKATCSNCGKTCEVPFRPTGEKPVYCNDCFGATKGREGGARSFEKRDFKPRESYRPREVVPAPAPDKRIDDLKKQLDAIQRKLDDVMQLITATKISAVLTKVESKKKETTAKKKVEPKKK